MNNIDKPKGDLIDSLIEAIGNEGFTKQNDLSSLVSLLESSTKVR
jgi:hypothetical protein